MKVFNRPLVLKDVLPSALSVVVLGVVLSSFVVANWSLLGVLGWWAIPGGVLFGLALYGLCFGLTCWRPFYTPSMRQLMHTLHSLFKNFSWFDIVFVSCLAGIGEELLLRGALQTWLIELINPVSGVLIASLVFGLMHYLSRIYVIVTTVLGILFGVALVLSDSILFVIIGHAIYDVCAFFMVVKRPDLLGLDLTNERFEIEVRDAGPLDN